MKRRTVLLIMVGWVVLVIAGILAWRFYKSLEGPAAPVCALPPLARKTFDPPTQLSGPKTSGARRYDIEPTGALLRDGTLALAWNARDRIFGGSGLVTARVFADGGFDARALATNRFEAFDAWMTRADNDVLHLVWLAHNGGRPEKDMLVAQVLSLDGAQWSEIQPAHAVADCPDGGVGCLDKPMVAAVDGGVLIFAYSEAGEGLRVSAPGAPTSLKIAGGAYGDVSRSSSGALHVAVVDDAGDGGVPERPDDNAFGTTALRVKYLRSFDSGATWTTTFASDPAERVPFYFSNPQVVADDSRGFVYVAYPSGPPDGSWVIRLATSRDRGQTWTRVTVNDDAPCASHMTPHLALDEGTGTVHVTWLENRSGKGGLAYAACEPGGAKCGPNEAVNAAPFASYSYERHLSAWLSEYGVLEFDPVRRVLHAVWTQPVDENGRAISRIFHSRAQFAPLAQVSPPTRGVSNPCALMAALDHYIAQKLAQAPGIEDPRRWVIAPEENHPLLASLECATGAVELRRGLAAIDAGTERAMLFWSAADDAGTVRFIVTPGTTSPRGNFWGHLPTGLLLETHDGGWVAEEAPRGRELTGSKR